MKDFCKWLGVNEKVAKIVTWVLIMMITLIIVNTTLDSIGAPHYKLTSENLTKIDYNDLIRNIIGFIICIFNFYAIILLIFRVNKIKGTIKYAAIYLILNTLITNLFNYAIAQVFIVVYTLAFCYIYSKKNWKYIFYGIGSFAFNSIIQYICYIFKIQYLNFSNLNVTNGTYNQLITSIDYFVIIAVIIFAKEIIVKKKE